MLCLGSPIEPKLLDLLKHIDRPDVGDLQWVQPRNLFISYQDFFRMKPNYDLKELIGVLRFKILHKYLPIILKPRPVGFTFNSAVANGLAWPLAVSSVKDTRLDLHTMRNDLNKDLEAILKEACYSLQSIKFDPMIRLARIPSTSKGDPQLKSLELIKMPYKDENIIVDKLMLVKVTKDEFGLNYEYINIPE